MVSNVVEYGALPSVAIVVHEPPIDGRRWNATEPVPEPPVSEALAASVIVWRRFVPGSVRLLVGASVSDLTTFGLVAVATLPAASATR